MYKKKVRVSYFTKDMVESHTHGKFVPRVISVTVEGKSTKRYHNTLHIMSKLSKCARLLIDFLIERMDDNNQVNNNSLLKKDFNQLMRTTGNTDYGRVTVNKAFSELAESELLRRHESKKGTYEINPLYFCNGSEKHRQKLIRRHLEKPYRSEFNKIRREHYESLEAEED